MANIREKIKLVLRKNSVLVLVLCAGWFVLSIILLFTQEKHRLDAEFESMIIDSLNIHTQSNAAEINRIITEAERAIHTAETMLSYSGIDGSIKDRLERRNANVPIYPTNYISLEEMRANLSSFFTPANQGKALARLMQGETMVGDICYDENLGKYFLAILLPLREGEAITGALYTRLQAEGLFPQISESAVYQGVQNCLVTSEGDIVFNTFVPEQDGNLFESLDAYHLTETEIDRIASIISSPDIDSSIFIRHGEAYYVSAARLEYNGWHLVSFVRGPDVLLRSSEIFQSVIRTSIASILLTAAAVCVVFMMLLFNRKKLEEEQQRNKALAQRLEAMFEQHSALKVVFDAETGKIVEVNPAILKYFGYTRTEVLGRSIYEFNLLPPEIIDEKFKNINGDVLFSSAPHRLKGGKTRLFDAYASAVMDGDNRLFYAILFDVTDREVYRNELLQEKELLKTTLQSIGDGVVTTDNFGFITSLNSVAEKLTGWDRGTAVGKYFTEVFTLRNEDTGQPVENPIQKVLATGLVVGLANHTEMVNRQGECIPIADSAAPIKAEDGQTFGVVMVFRDVSDEKEHIKQIEFLSYHDSLTGLYNRHYIEETMTRLDAAEYLPVSVVMADVNGLKITNDVFGHKAGDALLKKSADLMRKCCKEDDLIARWGGDEFVILMPGTSLEEAEAVIKKLKMPISPSKTAVYPSVCHWAAPAKIRQKTVSRLPCNKGKNICISKNYWRARASGTQLSVPCWLPFMKRAMKPRNIRNGLRHTATP